MSFAQKLTKYIYIFLPLVPTWDVGYDLQGNSHSPEKSIQETQMPGNLL